MDAASYDSAGQVRMEKFYYVYILQSDVIRNGSIPA